MALSASTAEQVYNIFRRHVSEQKVRADHHRSVQRTRQQELPGRPEENSQEASRQENDVNRIVNTAETKGYVHDAERPWLAIDGKHVVGRFETDQEAVAALRLRQNQKGEKGGLVIWRDAGPDDPMYKEGYRSYSPHWAQPFTATKSPPAPQSTKPRKSRKIISAKRRD